MNFGSPLVLTKNIQYDVYTTTKEVIKDFRCTQENKLKDKSPEQGSFFNNVSKFGFQANFGWNNTSRIAGSIVQDGRRLRSGRQAFCIIYLIISLRNGIFMVYSATESYYSQTLSFASLHKCMVDFWFILLRNGTIPQHYLSPRE